MTYRIHRINIILVFVTQGFNTFGSVLATKKLMKALNFSIGNFLAFRVQIGNTSIYLRRTLTEQKELRYNKNIYHTSKQFD